MKDKQVLIVRKDLKMPKGKIGSQCGHGATKIFFDRGSIVETPETPDTPFELRIPLTNPMYRWYKGIFTKVVLAASSEDELMNLKKMADDMGIPTALSEDCGLTCFDGVTTRTVLALGPDTEERIDQVSGHLPLLN